MVIGIGRHVQRESHNISCHLVSPNFLRYLFTRYTGFATYRAQWDGVDEITLFADENTKIVNQLHLQHLTLNSVQLYLQHKYSLFHHSRKDISSPREEINNCATISGLEKVHNKNSIQFNSYTNTISVCKLDTELSLGFVLHIFSQ